MSRKLIYNIKYEYEEDDNKVTLNKVDSISTDKILLAEIEIPYSNCREDLLADCNNVLSDSLPMEDTPIMESRTSVPLYLTPDNIIETGTNNMIENFGNVNTNIYLIFYIILFILAILIFYLLLHRNN